MAAWRCPTRLFVQPGGLESILPGVAASLGTRFALVCDAGLAATPWPQRVEAGLRAAGLSLRLRFDKVEANPSCRTAEVLASQLVESGADAVVALGGGSVIDAAKAAAMLATNVRPGRTSALSFEGLNTFQWPGLPLLAVPTTCGTGSEVTWVSVLTDTEDRRKLSIKGKHMFPAAAIVDSHVLRSLPAKLVSYTGLDALTHALEATLCRPGVSHAVSDVLAEEATTLLLSNLRAAAAGGDDSALEAVARGSTMAGLAFGNADVGAVHCLSETIGGLYGVPHGLGNAIFLHAALRFHLRREDGATRGTGAVRARLERLAQRAQLDAQCAFRGIRDGGERSEGAELLLGAVEALVRDLRIPPLSSLSLPAADWEKIAALSVSNCSNVSNPGGELTKSDYLSIMHAAG